MGKRSFTDTRSTLLIVDDDPKARDRHAGALRDLESVSLRSVPVADALSIIHGQPGPGIAAAFIEHSPKGASGREAIIRSLMERGQRIPFTLLADSADEAIGEIERLLGAGTSADWDVLQRPFTDAQLLHKARQMVLRSERDRQAQERAEAAGRAGRYEGAGVVARGVGHEFGNILLRIMGKTDLAMLERDPSKVSGHLEVIMASAERAGSIVRNLQSFSKSPPELQLQPVTAAVEHALGMVGGELGKYSIRIEKRLAEVPPAEIDVGRLSHVFVNLLVNARQAMPEGGSVTITASEAGGPEADGSRPGVAVSVADTGQGIPPEVLPRIFEFGFTTKGDRGTGLGLSVARETVRAHGGDIRVRTEPGKGSEFTVWIPLPERRNG